MMDLNVLHSELVGQILQISKYQKIQRLKSVDHCFKNSLARLREDEVYTGEEVGLVIKALQDTVMNETDTELNDANHTNALLIHQLLANAEKWHLTLTIDLSHLENRDKLNDIREFEENQGEGSRKLSNLQPIEDIGESNKISGLKIEVSVLKEQNNLLEQKCKALELELDNLKKSHEDKERESLDKISTILQELEIEKSKSHSLESGKTKDESKELDVLQTELNKTKAELYESRINRDEESKKLRNELEERENTLRQVQSSLLLAEKELNKKFQATSAFENMKKILGQKNNMIKMLRAKLDESGVHLEEVENLE